MQDSRNHLPSLLSFVRQNSLYLVGFVLFMISLFALCSQLELGEAVLWTNDNRTTFWDFVFKYGTKLGEEPAYLLLILILLFVRFRSAIWIPVVGIVVMVVSNLLKNYFLYARPIVHFKFSGEYELLKPLEGVFLHEGWNSFPSGHTMSGFALYSFLAFCISSKHKIWAAPICLLLAIIVGLSRIYLLQHFLRDVIFGAGVGLALGIALYYLHLRIFPGPHKWLDRSINGSINHAPADAKA